MPVLLIVFVTFDVLSTLPDWYQYLLFLAVSASFGIRGADKLMKLRRNDSDQLNMAHYSSFANADDVDNDLSRG